LIEETCKKAFGAEVRFGPPAEAGMETARAIASAVQSIARLTLIDLATAETDDPPFNRFLACSTRSPINLTGTARSSASLHCRDFSLRPLELASALPNDLRSLPVGHHGVLRE
jgi:hypothetical protein